MKDVNGMDLDDLCQELEQNADHEKAKQMVKYMRNQFSNLGIQTPRRKEITSPYFKEAKKTKIIDWDFVDSCWEKPYREAQYAAIDYLKIMKDFLIIDDMEKIKELVITKSWWDTVDGLHRMIGALALRNPEVDNLMIQWSLDENIWLRRIAINHQMHRKEKMNVDLLEKIMVNTLDQEEFFINKAIGWALRDYSKTNPTWVREFIDQYRGKLSKLSISEGSKYL